MIACRFIYKHWNGLWSIEIWCDGSCFQIQEKSFWHWQTMRPNLTGFNLQFLKSWATKNPFWQTKWNFSNYIRSKSKNLIKNLLPLNTLESFVVFEENLTNQPFATQMVCIGYFLYALFINLTNRMNLQIYKHLIW